MKTSFLPDNINSYFVLFHYEVSGISRQDMPPTEYATGLISRLTKYSLIDGAYYVAEALICLPRDVKCIIVHSNNWNFDNGGVKEKNGQINSRGSLFFRKIGDLDLRYSLYKTRIRWNNTASPPPFHIQELVWSDCNFSNFSKAIIVFCHDKTSSIARILEESPSNKPFLFKPIGQNLSDQMTGAPVFDSNGRLAGWAAAPDKNSETIRLMPFPQNMRDDIRRELFPDYFNDLIRESMRMYILFDGPGSIGLPHNPTDYYNFCEILIKSNELKNDVYGRREQLQIAKELLSGIPSGEERFMLTDMVHLAINETVNSFNDKIQNAIATYYEHDHSGVLKILVDEMKREIRKHKSIQLSPYLSAGFFSSIPQNNTIKSSYDLKSEISNGGSDAHSIAESTLIYGINPGHTASNIRNIKNTIYKPYRKQKMKGTKDVKFVLPSDAREITLPLPNDRRGVFDLFLYRLVAIEAAGLI